MMCWPDSFSCRVYIDLSHRDTLGHGWMLVRCCHLIVCLVGLMAWIRGCWLWLCYHDDYCITLPVTLTWVDVLLVYACYSL
jgi:hypothetical protein